MAEIRFEVEVDGADDGARKVDNLGRSMGDLGRDASAAGRKVKTAGDDIQDAGRKSDTASSAVEALSGAFGTVTTVVAGATAALTAATAGFVAFANEFERRAGIMRSFSVSIEETQRRTNGLVSSLEAMNVANRLARNGIQVTGHDLANVMVAAIDIAQESGEDLAATIERLSDALGGASADELRKFGVEIDSSKGRVIALTDALDQLDTQYGETEASATSFGGALSQAVNLADDLGTAFMEVVNAADDLGQEWDQLMEDFGLSELTLANVRDTMQDVAIAFGVTFVEGIILARQEITHFLQMIGQVMNAVGRGDFRSALDSIRTFTDASQQRRGDFGNRIAQRSAEVGARLASDRERRERSSSTRRIRRGFDSSPDRPDAPPDIDALMRSASAGGDFTSFIDKINEDAEKAANELEERLLDKRKKRARELFEEQQRLLEKQKKAAEEAFQATADTAEAVLTPVMSGLTDALASVVAGAENADRAFQNLLASFLEMISQQAALEAAKEFASAIASFASQDLAGGALHLAAGAAWTAVAVASGAASVAVAPPSASAAPASPQQQPEPARAGGDIVVNLNGAVVTAATHAELGRELSRTIAAGGRRFGVAA